MKETSNRQIYIGMMSGTSLDGVDAVAATFEDGKFQFKGRSFEAYSPNLKSWLLKLCTPGDDEISQMQVAGNEIANLYAKTYRRLLEENSLDPEEIAAIGAHGQTIRHNPQLGVSTQIINGALLAELTGQDVIVDFRNRDLAAGGQGAPLVPAFHAGVFAGDVPRCIVNIGGISNITVIDQKNSSAPVFGFDCGPGNMLMDAWINMQKGLPYDAGGKWAESGNLIEALMSDFLKEDYFEMDPPKSTGRELFNLQWLTAKLKDDYAPNDVQRTLLALTVEAISQSIEKYAPYAEEVYLCGGGARNDFLVKELTAQLSERHVGQTNELGLDIQDVEGAAFAWLAYRFCNRLSGNLPAVTGAVGDRILGCLYPA